MAFKMKGFSGFGNKEERLIKRAKRKIRKADKLGAVGGDFSKNERQFSRGERKRDKAVDLLTKAGYSDMQIEEATGSDGRRVAMDWAEGYGADPIKDIKIDKRRARKKYNKELKEAKENRKEERKLNSPQKASKQLVKKGLKTGAKVVGKRILKTALGPVGLAWDAYDIARAANKWRKKRRK